MTDWYICTTCNRCFDIGPIMLNLAAEPNPDWDAALHCPYCDGTTIKQAKDIVIHDPAPSLN